MLFFFSRKKTEASLEDPASALFDETSEAESSADTTEEEIELPVDLIRHEGELIIHAPLVGAKEEDISVTVRGNEITISKNATAPKSPGEILINECYWGPLSRTISLEEKIEPEKITAELKKGVLTVRLPFWREKTKVVQITADEEEENH